MWVKNFHLKNNFLYSTFHFMLDPLLFFKDISFQFFFVNILLNFKFLYGYICIFTSLKSIYYFKCHLIMPFKKNKKTEMSCLL